MVLFIGKYKFELAYLAYPSNDLARPDLISFINADSGQITIRCEIFSVTDDHRIDEAGEARLIRGDLDGFLTQRGSHRGRRLRIDHLQGLRHGTRLLGGQLAPS